MDSTTSTSHIDRNPVVFFDIALGGMYIKWYNLLQPRSPEPVKLQKHVHLKLEMRSINMSIRWCCAATGSYSIKACTMQQIEY